LVECEARELPSDGEQAKFSLWSERKKNIKANKWGMGMDFFGGVRGF
jgi:exonuclease III